MATPPQTLPADFFSKQQAAPPDTLPADFFSKQQAAPAAAARPAAPQNPDPGLWHVLGEALKNGPTAFMDFITGHPIQQLSEHGKEMGDLAKEAYRQQDYPKMIGYGLASFIPGSGDEAVASGQEFAQGHPGAGTAHAVLALAPFLAGTLIEGGTKIAPMATETAKGAARGTADVVSGAASNPLVVKSVESVPGVGPVLGAGLRKVSTVNKFVNAVTGDAAPASTEAVVKGIHYPEGNYPGSGKPATAPKPTGPPAGLPDDYTPPRPAPTSIADLQAQARQAEQARQAQIAQNVQTLTPKPAEAPATTSPGSPSEPVPTAGADYALAGTHVDGLKVRSDIPNLSSIDSSIENAEVLPGVRNFPLDAFADKNMGQSPYGFYSASDVERVDRLADQIRQSGEINPLIVAIDKDGPYILEGSHRVSALAKLGKKSIPAMVVIDRDSIPAAAPPQAGPLPVRGPQPAVPVSGTPTIEGPQFPARNGFMPDQMPGGRAGERTPVPANLRSTLGDHSDLDALRAGFEEVDSKPPMQPRSALQDAVDRNKQTVEANKAKLTPKENGADKRAISPYWEDGTPKSKEAITQEIKAARADQKAARWAKALHAEDITSEDVGNIHLDEEWNQLADGLKAKGLLEKTEEIPNTSRPLIADKLSILERLKQAGQEATQRLRDSGDLNGSNLSANPFADPKKIRDFAISIAGDIATGALKFGEWADGMVKKYGESVKPHLENIWNQATDLASGFDRAIAGQRGERAVADRVRVPQVEKDLVGEAASGLPAESQRDFTKAAIQRIRDTRADFPTSGDFPFQPFEVSKVEANTAKNGAVTPAIEYKKIPYGFDAPVRGQDLWLGGKKNDPTVLTPKGAQVADKMAQVLVDEVEAVRAKAAQAQADIAKGVSPNSDGATAIRIDAQKAWYTKMRTLLRQQFGSAADRFADLLGATSSRTPVATNWAQGLEALERSSKGHYDDIIPAYQAFREAGGGQKEYQGPLALRYGDKNFNANTRQVNDVLANVWRGNEGTPKTQNYAGNFTGLSNDATVDVWAARLLQRIRDQVYGDARRIPAPAETGVSGKLLPKGTSGQFMFGQQVFTRAAQKLGMQPHELQALAWFLEKDLWTRKGVTSAVGEGGDMAASLQRENLGRMVAGIEPADSSVPQNAVDMMKPVVEVAKTSPDVKSIVNTPARGLWSAPGGEGEQPGRRIRGAHYTG